MGAQATYPSTAESSSSWARGIAFFAGVVLLVASCFQIVEGIAAIGGDELLAVGEEYVFALDVTAWGWFHLVFGLIGLVTAIGVIARRTWGWTLGILVACVAMISNFAWLPYYPLWAIAVIVLDGAVIWAFGRLLSDAV